MDELISEFLEEAFEGLAELDNELVRLETEPNDIELLSSIFRTFHTIKGTCGFIGLSRLEALSHVAESLLSRFRDGELPVTPIRVTLILESIDRLKAHLIYLQQNEREPEGDDAELIARLNAALDGQDDDGAADAPAAEAEDADASGDDEAEAAVDLDVQADDGDRAEDTELAPAAVDARLNGESFYGTAADDFVGHDAGAARVSAGLRLVEAAVPDIAEPDVEADAAVAEPAAEARSGKANGAQTIRVSVDLLENLMTMVSELVLTRNQLVQYARSDQEGEIGVPLQRLNQVTSELQEGVMKTRMQPIGNAWSKLPRLVRDLNRDLSKRSDLVMSGADTELDRQVLENIRDPLTHMVRNAIDHGIELPAMRVAAGKPEVARIVVDARHEGGHIIVEVSDDGRGLDADKLKKKAVSKGLISEAEAAAMSETQAYQLIFRAGFSTAETVTSVSGRGVGMDVVRTNVDNIGGTIEVKSAMGKGTRFIIKIPLTLAIISALIVSAGGERFAIPQLSVIELVRAKGTSEHRIERVSGTPVLRLRNRLLPLVSLRTLLGLDAVEDGSEDFVVVTQVGSYRFGLLVDRVFDTEEIVVKPVATILRDITAFSGNTILGDGSVIMILDPNGIAATTGEIAVHERAANAGKDAAHAGQSGRQTYLVFLCGRSRMAVPLDLVARIEMVELAKVENAGGRTMIQYRDALMPLIQVDTGVELPQEGSRPVLVFRDDERWMGLIVDEVDDVVDGTNAIGLESKRQGVLGNAVIAGKATEILDTGYYLTQGFADWFERRPMPGDREGGTRRVLAIDDSTFFLGVLSPLLNAAGFSVTTVGSAQEALALCDAGETYDVIVTDIEMPEIDGFQFAERVKQSRWAETPVVALSSRTDERHVARGRLAGFADYVPKLERELLIETLTELAA